MTPVLRTTNSIDSHWAELFDGVDDLIHRIADAENPEIRKSRARVYATMVIARNALEQDATQQGSLAQIGDIAEPHVPVHTAQKVALNVLLGLGLGLITSRSR